MQKDLFENNIRDYTLDNNNNNNNNLYLSKSRTYLLSNGELLYNNVTV